MAFGEKACLLELLPGCGALVPPPLAAPGPLVSGSSSWLNLTPSPFPTSYPDSREGASLAYDPDSHSVLLFGGAGPAGLYQDTWSWTAGTWTELIAGAGCTPATCPSPRAGAGMTYDAADQEMVLFGGLVAQSYPGVVSGDTWVFTNGAWRNVTGSVGAAPPPRYDLSLTFDSGDNYVLLFGGANASFVPFADTWTFRGGAWTNLTASLLLHPDAREGAAMADSPLGYVLLFGGLGPTSLIQNYYGTGGGPYLGWWFHNGTWSPMSVPIQPAAPIGHGGSSDVYGPCGRYGAALSWSPRNNRFVLFGGFGVVGNGTACGSAIFLYPLNDTWVYEGSLGGVFNSTADYWYNDSVGGGPSPRGLVASASDYTDGYLIIFGGSLGIPGGFATVNETWRYYQKVAVRFSGPTVLQTGQLGFDQFLLRGVGGSGVLNYSSTEVPLKNAHTLDNCSGLTDGLAHPLPTFGYVPCAPSVSSYNIYRLSVVVWDFLQPTDRAYANWTVTVSPPEALRLYSEYKGYFYEGFQVSNVFGVYAQIGDASVTGVSATLDGFSLGFSHSNASAFWWNSTPFDMGSIGPGAVLEVTATVSDWNESASLPVTVIQIPDWLQQIVSLAGVLQSQTQTGTGPFGLSYSLVQTVPLPIGKIFNFSLPIPLVSGNYSLIPSLQLAFTETSSGNISLTGTFALSTPSISLGVFNMTLSATVAVTGTFGLTPAGSDSYTVTWLKASVAITIKGDFRASFPIYGFSFDFLGATVKVGFTLDIDIAPAVGLQIILLPTTEPANEVAQGLSLMVSELLGSFTLPISADVSFGIGIASVALGGTLSVALAYSVSPGPFELTGIWVNGSVFVSAQVLFWSGSWNLIGPGVIYYYQPAPLAPRAAAVATVPYDNGSDATWTVDPRAYNTSGYDLNVWSPTASSGPAIANIYPKAAVSAAAAADGAYLFYTDDRVGLPVSRGLTVAGVRLDPTTNVLDPVPGPVDPGYVIARPQATNLPDGSLYALWEALPLSEAGASSPAGVTSLALHGARYDPASGTWGPVRAWTSSGVVQSYAVDATGGTERVAALVSPALIPTATTPEWLTTDNLTTGATVTNASVTGLSSIESLRGGGGFAAVRSLDGNFSVLRLVDGSEVTLPAGTSPPGAALVSAAFVPGSASTLLLRYRNASAGSLVLTDLAGGGGGFTLPVGGDVTDAHALAAGGRTYLFAATAAGVTGWAVGASAPIAQFPGAGYSRFGVVQDGRSLLLYAVGSNATGAPKSLLLSVVPATLPALPEAPAPASPSASAATYLLYLGIEGGAVAILLAVIAVRGRRPRAPGAAPAAPPAESGPSGGGNAR